MINSGYMTNILTIIYKRKSYMGASTVDLSRNILDHDTIEAFVFKSVLPL